jgi:hypothetical protein
MTTVRRATEADASALIELRHKLFAETLLVDGAYVDEFLMSIIHAG